MGRKPITHPEFDRVVAKWKSGGMTAVDAIRKLGMTPSTFYRKVRQGDVQKI
jgi:DNA-binding MarR family transcriptional regulator